MKLFNYFWLHPISHTLSVATVTLGIVCELPAVVGKQQLLQTLSVHNFMKKIHRLKRLETTVVCLPQQQLSSITIIITKI